MPALHSNAPLVLLDWLLAFWALLGICLHPEVIFIVVFLLIKPHLHLFAVARFVLLFLTVAAEILATLTCDGFTHEITRKLDEVITSRLWTIRHIGV